MGLRTKFNLVLLAAFLVGLALSATVSYRVVHENAQREVAHEAEIMITAASAIRDYTAKEIKPLLIDQMKLRFLPHPTVSAWAAQYSMRTVSAQFPDYTYKGKQHSIRPIRADLATTIGEADIIAEFQSTPPTLKEFTNIRDTANGPIHVGVTSVAHCRQRLPPCHTTAVKGASHNGGSLWHHQWLRLETGRCHLVRKLFRFPMRVALDRADPGVHTVVSLPASCPVFSGDPAAVESSSALHDHSTVSTACR